MKKLLLLIVLILSSCTAPGTSQIVGPGTASPQEVNNSALLFEANFEEGFSEGLAIDGNTWKITADEQGNHAACNILWNDYSALNFGKSWWQDYTVEIKVRLVKTTKDGYVGMGTRLNDETWVGYSGALNFDNHTFDFANQDPYEVFQTGTLPPAKGDVYILKMDLFGDHIRFSINGKELGEAVDSRFAAGSVNFGASPNLQVCVDDIRVWLVDNSGKIVYPPEPIKPSLEVIAGEVTQDWGGYMGRIVRNQYGVFSNYIVPGDTVDHYLWKIAERQVDGTWTVITSGDAGKLGTNILIGEPTGKLYLIAWPKVDEALLWTIDVSGKDLVMESQPVQGVNVPQGTAHYGSAGINAEGDLCIVTSEGGNPIFRLGCYHPSDGSWTTGSLVTEYQFKYTYLFPQTGGGVMWIASRDETYEALGLTMPPEAGEFPYVANALGYWRTDDLSNQPARRLYYREEPQTKDYQNIILFPHDGYEDRSGNLHYLYWIKGQSTRGNWRVRHAALTPSGELINDVQLPDEIGAYSNIFQDGEGKFWILGSGGLLFPAGQDGFHLGAPYLFDLGGYEVSYAGFYIACPRHGTVIEDVVDVVFPTNEGRTWMYFRLDLPDL